MSLNVQNWRNIYKNYIKRSIMNIKYEYLMNKSAFKMKINENAKYKLYILNRCI